jgi:hypothetical protein
MAHTQMLSGAEKLMNFDEKLDIQLLDTVVECMNTQTGWWEIAKPFRKFDFCR